jgi:hypothetical protein
VPRFSFVAVRDVEVYGGVVDVNVPEAMLLNPGLRRQRWVYLDLIAPRPG